MDTSARLLNLLSLLQTPREWSGTELADRLDVSTRTIRRYIDRLRELGYPVEATMGTIGGYRLIAGRALPPLLLDDEEAVAIAVGLRAAAGSAVDGIEDASLRALTKLEQVLPSRLRYRVGALGTAVVAMTGGGPRVEPAVLTVLAGAITNHERVRFSYRAAAGTETRRHIEPQRLVANGRRWYLVAWDLDRDDWRLFRVDRLADPTATGARATARELPAADAAAFVQDKLRGMWPSAPVVVDFAAEPETVRAHLGQATTGELEPLPNGGSRWSVDADRLDWMAVRLLMLDLPFTVQSPPALVERLRTFGERARAATA
ncbi:Predicted DNA-binding transcriptional regulator YafY, contains an HTH and WYL domains [Streptacidiphilus jiangxiensis]|uniref:Predicted DNA-binding transcriptional regulator YafY, contains an HTH and WYL domains n=2 Tax=Streptacidiphilus jiangxiensis TaxID=235985 RepID=A0A1H7KWV7_STRJI|nr:Predicted DNA-binding transcriptional regulator YafY, contains an HTH and WYL domains [Streptacidiphilus jiangxiensis]